MTIGAECDGCGWVGTVRTGWMRERETPRLRVPAHVLARAGDRLRVRLRWVACPKCSGRLRRAIEGPAGGQVVRLADRFSWPR